MTFPIYLISMQKDIERREKLKASFPASYEKFTLIPAVNGGELSANDYFKIMFCEGLYPITPPSEVGCALSHVEALEVFLSSGADAALIIEDDIIGDENCFVFLSELLKKMKKMSGEFLLHCGGISKSRRIFAKKTQPFGENVFEIPPVGYFALTMACSYVVTRSAARQILLRQKEALHIADNWDYLLRGADFPVYYCRIFDHSTDITPSGLQSGRVFAKRAGRADKRLPFSISLYKAARETKKVFKQIRAYFSSCKAVNV